MFHRTLLIFLTALISWGQFILAEGAENDSGSRPLSVGAGIGSFKADDAMQVGGNIGPAYVKGQEGDVRAVAFVLEQPGSGKFAIVACDVLFVTRAMIDKVAAQIEKSCGIPPSNLLVNATHTHHVPSTVRIHGAEPEPAFIQSVEEGVVTAVEEANRRLTPGCQMSFFLNEDVNVGKNSRLLLGDNTVYWVGTADDVVRPTGPFDPQLPVLSFRAGDGRLVGVLYNHSTHTVGTLAPRVRSPSFYGLAAQELEKQWNAPVCFLEGASGSTHNLTHSVADAITIMKKAVAEGVEKGSPVAVNRLAAIKRPFVFKVRTFDEEVEDQKVISYCTKRVPVLTERCTDIFREMRRQLKPEQGKERETWLQVMLIGDVAIVGVPAEFFTALGVDIKKRSPFKHTYVAELANDWIGYLPDREGHQLGGYQTWTGLHSYAEVGTGERVVDNVVAMLHELAKP
jgi:neutral ceramidase